MFLSSVDFFFFQNLIFQRNLSGIPSVCQLTTLDHFVGPYLGPNRLPWLLPDRVKMLFSLFFKGLPNP